MNGRKVLSLSSLWRPAIGTTGRAETSTVAGRRAAGNECHGLRELSFTPIHGTVRAGDGRGCGYFRIHPSIYICSVSRSRNRIDGRRDGKGIDLMDYSILRKGRWPRGSVEWIRSARTETNPAPRTNVTLSIYVLRNGDRVTIGGSGQPCGEGLEGARADSSD